MAAGEESAYSAQAQAPETLGNMYEPWGNVKNLEQTVSVERARISEIFDAQLICLRAVIAVLLFKK